MFVLFAWSKAKQKMKKGDFLFWWILEVHSKEWKFTKKFWREVGFGQLPFHVIALKPRAEAIESNGSSTVFNMEGVTFCS